MTTLPFRVVLAGALLALAFAAPLAAGAGAGAAEGEPATVAFQGYSASPYASPTVTYWVVPHSGWGWSSYAYPGGVGFVYPRPYFCNYWYPWASVGISPAQCYAPLGSSYGWGW